MLRVEVEYPAGSTLELMFVVEKLQLVESLCDIVVVVVIISLFVRDQTQEPLAITRKKV